ARSARASPLGMWRPPDAESTPLRSLPQSTSSLATSSPKSNVGSARAQSQSTPFVPPLHTVERGTGGEDHTVQRGSREPGAVDDFAVLLPAPFAHPFPLRRSVTSRSSCAQSTIWRRSNGFLRTVQGL